MHIAFIHYPHSPASARLDTMPFVMNALRMLGDAGHEIDVFFWEKKDSYSSGFPGNVHFHLQQDKWIRFVDSYYIRFHPLVFKEKSYAFRFRKGKKYDLVIAVGQIGAYIGHLISGRNKAPLVLFNDEFPSAWRSLNLEKKQNWEQLELEAARYASLIVVPDESRAAPLFSEWKFTKPYTVLPNTAAPGLPAGKINWHERIGIPAGKKICLNAGSVADFAQVPELMMSIESWPDDAVLVLNDRNRSSDSFIRKMYSHLDVPGKIFWNNGSLSEEEINSLVGYAAVNFALYRNLGPNIEHIGFSSGKLMRSIAMGVPVITSDFDSLSFVGTNNLGMNISKPSEIGPAIRKILADETEYRRNCALFYKEHCNFNLFWEKFRVSVDRSAGVKI